MELPFPLFSQGNGIHHSFFCSVTSRSGNRRREEGCHGGVPRWWCILFFRLNKVQIKGTQGVQARYNAELLPFIPNPRQPGRPVILQGRANPAFSKPCLCLSDTRHFRHFHRFRGSEERSPCFQWVECKFVIFTVFVKTASFWQGTKTRFTTNTVCATPKLGMEEGTLSNRLISVALFLASVHICYLFFTVMPGDFTTSE